MPLASVAEHKGAPGYRETSERQVNPPSATVRTRDQGKKRHQMLAPASGLLRRCFVAGRGNAAATAGLTAGSVAAGESTALSYRIATDLLEAGGRLQQLSSLVGTR